MARIECGGSSARASAILPSRISPISSSARSVIAATSPSRSTKWRYRIGLLMPPAVAISSIVTSAPSRRITSMAASSSSLRRRRRRSASDARGPRCGLVMAGTSIIVSAARRRRVLRWPDDRPLTAPERATFTAMAEGTQEDWDQHRRFGAGVLPRARRSRDHPPAPARRRLRRLPRRPPDALAADGDAGVPGQPRRRLRRLRPAPRHRRHARLVQPRRHRRGDRQAVRRATSCTGWSRSTASSRATTSSTSSASTATCATSSSATRYYDLTAEFCADFDQPAFDPDYPTMTLEEFTPLLQQFFSSPKRSIYLRDDEAMSDRPA